MVALFDVLVLSGPMALFSFNVSLLVVCWKYKDLWLQTKYKKTYLHNQKRLTDDKNNLFLSIWKHRRTAKLSSQDATLRLQLQLYISEH